MSEKINQLLKDWPKHTVVTLSHLRSYGIDRKRASYHATKSGWLEKLGTGAYVRPGDTIDWQGGLYALQTQLGLTVHVGGVTALQLAGLGHYLPLGPSSEVILLSDGPEHLPKWFRDHSWRARVQHHSTKLLYKSTDYSLVDIDCGGFDVRGSCPERAMMESIKLAEGNDALVYVREVMGGLNTLRPSMVQDLLEDCRSIKVKRFFLWCAEDAQHPWFSRLDLDRISLGQGKRQLFKDGVYDSRYQITVPPTEPLPDV